MPLKLVHNRVPCQLFVDKLDLIDFGVSYANGGNEQLKKYKLLGLYICTDCLLEEENNVYFSNVTKYSIWKYDNPIKAIINDILRPFLLGHNIFKIDGRRWEEMKEKGEGYKYKIDD